MPRTLIDRNHPLFRLGAELDDASRRLRDALATQLTSTGSEGEIVRVITDSWAVTAEIVNAYSALVAGGSYLGTADDLQSLSRLLALLGYQPRPGLAATVPLAAIAAGAVSLAPGVRIASGPQVYETPRSSAALARNEWLVAGVPGPGPSRNRLLLDAKTARVAVGQIVLIEGSLPVFSPIGVLAGGNLLLSTDQVAHLTMASTTPVASPGQARRVVSAEIAREADGALYSDVTLSAPLRIVPSSSPVRALAPSLTASVTRFKPVQPYRGVFQGMGNIVFDGQPATVIHLDAQYTQIGTRASLVIENRDAYASTTVIEAEQAQVIVSSSGDSDLRVPVTVVVVQPSLGDWSAAQDTLRIHFNLVEVGRLANVAKTELVREDFATGVPIVGPAEPLDGPVTDFLLEDANGQGVDVTGEVVVRVDGSGYVRVDPGPPFPAPLRIPVRALGNVIRATRGQTVANEVLGSGDGTATFQRFRLRKQPLTYLRDATAPDGRRSTLAVRVDGLLWREVSSFFGAGPTNPVYIVRHDADQRTEITFGDGVRGSRLPTGVDNVVATYRYGSGAETSPPGTITQLVGQVPGLRRVKNPVAPSGGADPDAPADLRRNAPRSALTFGRAIGVPDFEAIARDLGVVNARATWGWAGAAQRAAVIVWVIADSDDTAAAVGDALAAEAAIGTPISVIRARPVAAALALELAVDPRFDPAAVTDAVRAVLLDDQTGFFGAAAIEIGRPRFRSALLEAVTSVAGVGAVRAASWNRAPVPLAMEPGEGRYFDVAAGLTIATFAGGDA